MDFQQRQSIRVGKRRKHQRDMAKLMRKVGGWQSSSWSTFISKIKLKIMRRLQMAKARKEAKISNAI